MNFFHHSKSSSHEPVALRKRNLFGRLGRDPEIDWIIICFVALLVAVSLVVLSFRLGYSVYRQLETRSSPAASKAPKASDTRLLDSVLGDYAGRAKARAEIGKSYAGPSDPSM